MLKSILQKVLHKIFGDGSKDFQPKTVKQNSGGWTTEVVVSPQYWIESNYVMVDKLPPMLVPLAEHMVKSGHACDLATEVGKKTAQLIFNTFVEQLKAKLPNDQEASWKLHLENDVICLDAKAKHEAGWRKLSVACDNIEQKLKGNGVQLVHMLKRIDRPKYELMVRFPVDKLKLDVDNNLCWDVLQANKGKVILWNKKMWLPKK